MLCKGCWARYRIRRKIRVLRREATALTKEGTIDVTHYRPDLYRRAYAKFQRADRLEEHLEWW